MLTSTRWRVRVMDEVMRHTYARPSCMTTAARSALRVWSQARSTSSDATLSHPGFAKVNFRFVSSSSVWYAPSLTNSFSTMFLPLSRIIGVCASKSTFSTLMVNWMRSFSLDTEPVMLSEATFRMVVVRTESPTEIRLYTVHKSSASSGTSATRPPSLEISFVISFIAAASLKQKLPSSTQKSTSLPATAAAILRWGCDDSDKCEEQVGREL
mmetsp:Transcript_24011/g.57295  ORF Transcript_24011/g.57295 Transcript_24011/m.57295 type:complete len:212 (+) Transcript_24011:909-1544(+)